MVLYCRFFGNVTVHVLQDAGLLLDVPRPECSIKPQFVDRTLLQHSVLVGVDPLPSANTHWVLDRQLGLSIEEAIPVGGGVIFGPSNERAVLDRLRGPDGEVLEYHRLGSTLPPGEDSGPIDVYEIRHAGLFGVSRLYFDVYTPGPQGIPRHLTLANPLRPFNLPKTTTRVFGDDDLTPTKPQKWRLANKYNEILGYATWMGTEIELEVDPQDEPWIRADVERFVDMAPRQIVPDVLSDYFERYLPTHTNDFLIGHPITPPRRRG